MAQTTSSERPSAQTGPIARAEERRTLIRYLESALQLALGLPNDEASTLEYIQGDLEKAKTLVDERLEAIEEGA